ncbi:MAG: hypothetical protein IK137_01890 [Bacilli bacterium]|nr:hypothetical protein [Bacilli bacterium]
MIVLFLFTNKQLYGIFNLRKVGIIMEEKQVNDGVLTYTTKTVNIPEEYKPISMWGYFGYELLFSIPCVGFIFLLVFAFGGTKNVNLKNFARSYFCYFIIAVGMAVIVITIMIALGGLSTIIERINTY